MHAALRDAGALGEAADGQAVETLDGGELRRLLDDVGP
jgi:hypothetical protein